MATAPAATPAPNSLEADVASVFGFNDDTSQAPAPAEPAEGEGVVAPSPSPEPAAPVAAPPPPPPAPAPAPAALPPLEAPAAQPGVAPAQPAQPAAAPAAPDPRDLQIANLTAMVERLQAQPQQPQPAAPSAPAAPGNDPSASEVRYNLQIPDAVLAAINHEDAAVQSQGMHHLINGLATNIHKQVRAEFEQGLTGLRTELANGTAEQQMQQRMETSKEQYFTVFPAHRDPTIQQIVASEGAQFAAEFPALPWDANYIAALGHRVNARIAALTGQVLPGQTAPAPAPAPTAALAPNAPVQPKPAAMLPTSPSTGIPAFEQGQDLILSTFGFGDG